MTSNQSQQSCPCCGSYEVVSAYNGKGVCHDCGFVITQLKGLTRNQRTNYSPEPTRGGISDEDWKEIVSPVDSSESQLVDLILEAEAVVRELRGNSQDCVHAAKILTTAWEQGYFHGRSAKAGVGAIVYVMFRQDQKSRPLGVVAEACGVSPKQLRGGYRTLRTRYGISGSVVDSSSYIPFLASELSLGKRIQKRAQSLIESVSDVRGSPSAVAAASLYVSAKTENHAITLVEAGNAAGVTKETVWLKTKEFKSKDGSTSK